MGCEMVGGNNIGWFAGTDNTARWSSGFWLIACDFDIIQGYAR
jgi:hypothetical protein